MAEQTTNDDSHWNPARFTAALEPLLDPAYRLATVILRDEAAAEEALVRASLTAWRKRRQVSGANAGFRPWFLSIVATEARRMRLRLLFRAQTAEEEEGWPEDDGSDDLRGVLSRQRPVERAALFCFFYLHLPMDEVAQILRTSTRAARTRIYRAAQRPRKDRQGTTAIDQLSLRDTFESMTRAPRASLVARIREAIEGRSARPRRRLPIPAGLPVLRLPRPSLRQPTFPSTALVTIAVLAGLLFVASGVVFMGRQVTAVLTSSLPSARPSPTAASPGLAGAPSASPASPVPVLPSPATPVPAPATPQPTAAVRPAPQAAPGFACGTLSGGGAGTAPLVAARLGTHPGYDRFVLEFNGPVPQIEVRAQDTPAFGSVTLSGSAGALVVVRNATASGGYPAVLRQAAPVLLEARQLDASGGAVQWGLGISRPTCFRILSLSGPSRLVVDLQH